MKTLRIQDIVISALGMALVFLATYLLKIPNGIQGYVNMGDGFILLFASILNPFLSFLVGGIGSALADVAGGYGIYMIPTMVIKGCEAVLVSYLVSKGKTSYRYLGYILGSIIMITGYFIVDAYVNQSWLLALSGILGNIIQGGVGCVIAIMAYPLIEKRAITLLHLHKKEA